MEIGGSTSITLAFSLTAMQKLQDPSAVVENARKWSDNIGVITNEPEIDVTDFEYDHSINFDFTSGPRDIDGGLEKALLMMATDRHIFIGTNTQHENAAEAFDWEYLSVEEAAAAAEWELVNEVDDITYDGDVFEIEEQIEASTHVEIPMNTLRWHQVNRGEKHWVVKPVNDEFNEETLTEDRVALLHRGVGESHQLWAVIQEVDVFDSAASIIDELSVEKVRPHSDQDNVVERIESTFGDPDEYIAVRVETVDPEENPEIFEQHAA